MLADLDPRADESPEEAKTRYRAALERFEPQPTAIVDSGNGIQCLWKLKERIELPPDAREIIEDVETRTKALMLRLGGTPGTQNIDRILRLPGTTNLPNAKKKKAGRNACPTALLEFNGAAYSLEDFPKDAEKKKPRERAGKAGLPRNLLVMLHIPDAGAGAAAGGYPTRSELLFAFINAALRAGVADDVIVATCLDPEYTDKAIYEHVQDSGGEEYVKKQIEHALNAAPTSDSPRKIIRVHEGELDANWRATERALIAAQCPIFVRKQALIQPLWRWEKSNDGTDREFLTAQFVKFNVPRLADVTAHHAVQFQKWDGRSKKYKNIDPPQRLIERLIEIGHWGFLTVTGIINSPTMRPDGSLLTTPGYDPATQLWYKSSSDIELPPIPERPTKADAEAALTLLNELLVGFPFDEETPEKKQSIARSVALAGIMTTVLRGAFPAVPIFAVVATEPRTGKTYLVHLIAVIATGHIPVPTAGSRKVEEMEKRIETAALSGRPIMHLNNLPNGMVVESEALSQMTTEGQAYIRTLGKHEEGLCDCRATTVFLNGNNILVAADLVPRTALCRLDAKTDKPEEREWDFKPIECVQGNRGAYLAAVFIIARAFLAAGCPKPKEMQIVAGFEAWSRMVQQPLMWLGMEDPFGGKEAMRAMDPKEEELHRLFSVLTKYHKDLAGKFTVADCERLAADLEHGGIARYKRQDLRDLMTFHGKINATSFGWMLRRHRDRIRGDWCLKSAAGGRVAAYQLVPSPREEPPL